MFFCYLCAVKVQNYSKFRALANAIYQLTVSQKSFYRYNMAKGHYERVYPSARTRAWILLRQFGWIAALAVGLVAVLFSILEFPRERRQRLQIERMQARLEVLNRQADEALAVMEDIADRDNNFYRAIMQAEPLSRPRRLAGLERQRNFDSLDSLSDASLLKTVGNKLEQLDRMIYSQIQSFDYLAQTSTDQKDRISHTPAIQPVPQKYLRTMASGYGVRVDPVYGTSKFHEGMDFSAPVGTPVYATADGTVRTASWQGAYGNMVEINHGFNYTTRYAHMSKINVKAGQTVHRGDLIGLVGNTGKSTGPHLHYEVRYRGAPQNPVNYYFYDLTPAQYDEIIRLADNAGHVMD